LCIPAEKKEQFLLYQIQAILNEKDPTEHLGTLIEMSDEIIKLYDIKDVSEMVRLSETLKKSRNRGFSDCKFKTLQQLRDRLGKTFYLKSVILGINLCPCELLSSGTLVHEVF